MPYVWFSWMPFSLVCISYLVFNYFNLRLMTVWEVIHLAVPRFLASHLNYCFSRITYGVYCISFNMTDSAELWQTQRVVLVWYRTGQVRLWLGCFYNKPVIQADWSTKSIWAGIDLTELTKSKSTRSKFENYVFNMCLNFIDIYYQ